MNLSWFVGIFFGGGRTWYRFWCAETYYVNISKKKGIFERKFKGIDLTELDSGIFVIISGRNPMPTSGVMFEKNVGNFHRRMTIGIHMLGLVECWQIFHGSRPIVCSEKESHQKGICNPWNLCWTCRIHTIREAIFGFPPFCSNGLFPPLLFSAIAHEFPLAACGHGPFFVPYHPGNLCLPFWVLLGAIVLVVQRRFREHPRGNRAPSHPWFNDAA